MRYLPFLLLLFLFSCKSDTSSLPPETDHMALVDTLKQEAPQQSDTLLPVARTLQIDTADLQPEPHTRVKILLPGSFQKKEVWRGAEQKQWLALTFQNGQYRLVPALITVKPVFDPLADRDSLHISGRAVTSDVEDAILFITGLQSHSASAVDTVAFTVDTLLPGEQLPLTFKNKTYELTAFGDSTTSDSTAQNALKNYGWKIAGLKNRRKLTQVLAEDPDFDSAIYVLLWAGDLDNDGIPDLVADLSNTYNKSKISVFLSRNAPTGKIYQQAASFEFQK